jgi:alpha-mannosidase
MCFQDSEVELERSFTGRSFAFTGTRAGFEVSFLDTAHYLVTKHSQTVRLTLFVAVTARVYSS